MPQGEGLGHSKVVSLRTIVASELAERQPPLS
jgi:hypothetical protein